MGIRRRIAGVVGLVFSLLIAPACALIAGRQLTEVEAPLPIGLPESGFTHAPFEALLRQFVAHDGRVDYASWHGDPAALAQLDSYLAAIAAYSPDNAPERFPAADDAFVYWVHAYNAFVIKAVLDRWPLESVTDVKANVEIVRGFGFFYTLEFVAGGERTNLYDLEHDKLIRDDIDARVHFVLNCGSEGCPVMQPELPTGGELERVLADAAREFVSDPRNVSIDHTAGTLTLSSIFDWYEADFASDLRRRGLPAERGIVDYLLFVAPESMRAELERAVGYEVVHAEYDWALNDIAETR